MRPTDTNPTDTNPTHTNPTGTGPTETDSVGTRSTDTRSTDTRSTGTRSTDRHPTAVGPTVTRLTAPGPSPRTVPGTGGRAAASCTPRRTDCPWCGSVRLRTRLRTTDLLRHLPGSFVLDECGDCGHIFQNPRLTAAARAERCRDLREGLGTALAEQLTGARHSARRHRAAADAVLRFGEPESWLDVGTGRALFPAVAREQHPYVAFDGLDEGAVVELAAADGHIDEAHRGTLPARAPQLAGRYDAVSMFHHLEHAEDPRAELRAARTVLRPGGLLLVETADPESRFAALLGRWWLPHLQPQHLQLIPLRNLRRALEDLGCTVIAAERRSAHVPYDLTAAVALLAGRALPGAVARAALPAVAAARAADRVIAPLACRTRLANTYRIIARRERTHACAPA